jgi:hypothetical protein
MKKQFVATANRVTGSVTFALGVLTLLCSPGEAQTIDPYYSSAYNIRALGEVPGLPENYGGFTFKAGDANTLLIGGDSEDPGAQIFQISVVRDATHHISNFAGTVQFVANAPGLPDASGGLDAGLVYGPGNVLLYTSYKDDSIGEIKPGQTSVTKQIDLTTIGVPASAGGLVIVPAGLPGAGRVKILTYNDAMWYDTALVPDGAGTFDLAPVAKSVSLSGNLEGAVYVPTGAPLFSKTSVLLCDYGADQILSFEVDSNGDPIAASQRTFVTDVGSVLGAGVDPVTGDFVFNSYSGDQVWVIGRLGITPPIVNITSPAEGAVFAAPANLPVAAEASQAGGVLDEVDFYVDGTYCGSSSENGSYSAYTGELGAGLHALFAVAMGSGLSTTSSVVHVLVTNTAPTVSIVAPLDYSSTSECAELLLSAATSDGSGPVTNVSYYPSPSTLLGSASKPPYAVVVSLPTGTNEIVAIATDDLGVSSTSASVHAVFVPTPPGWISANRISSQIFGSATAGRRTKRMFSSAPPASRAERVGLHW